MGFSSWGSRLIIGSMSRSFAWFLILSFFGFLMVYIIWYPDYREAERVQRKMMAMTTAALQESIIFTHMKYHMSSAAGSAKLDLLLLDGQGLDFNEKGYPVGFEHSESSLQLPLTVRDCRQLWDALLLTMRPMLDPAEDALFKVLAINGKCVFTSKKFFEQSIVYDPDTGRVQLSILKLNDYIN